ncbi:MAG: 4Fe-4S dicluster domain-containing protein [Clostridia bacterium]|nr:4Fe-4S dicluster domain-containing protein [Clostridia bacterium]
MSVLINFKICDNAKECGGIEVCPTEALSWDEENETIKIDNEKCISCGTCERNCPIGAISVTHTEEEYSKKKQEIEEDPRTTKDLFVDRYGAAPLSDFFMIEEDELDKKTGNGITLVECYEDDSIQCLLKSIPIKEITSDMPKDTMFYKIKTGAETKGKYDITELPTLLIFKNKKYLGKIDGYYSTENKEEFMNKINEIIN